jgi:hypothetical protein
MSPPISKAGEFGMARTALAKAVMEHANQFYDVGGWYVVAECWDVWSVLEELDRFEDETQTWFELDAGAIAHFAMIVDPRSAVP